MKKHYFYLLVILVISWINLAQAQVTEDYTWKNVPIGGGGYITGMKIHPLNGERRFYRTDVGGAYRWDPVSGRMKQMLFLENKDLYSVAGIALHPTNQNIVYLSVGRKCNPAQSAILISTDAGVNFTPLNIVVPFWFAANGGRDCGGNSDKDRQGTPLAINPHNTNELYIGTRGKGLYILNLTTLQLTDVPNSSIPDNSAFQSIRSVVFHPTLNLVYIAYTGHGVYVGNTLTQNYVRYGANSQTQLQDAIDISISKNANYLLVACKKQGIMKATGLTSTTSLNWSLLSGYNTADSEGYLTVDCSPHNDAVAITVVADWNHINEFQVTTNSGGNWNQIGGSVSQTDNQFKWRDDGFASHVSQIAFDPVNVSKMHYTSWFSTFACDNFSLTGPNSWNNSESKGHEEIVSTDLVAFPVNTDGQFLMVGSGDHSGFLFDSGITNENNFATFSIDDRVNGSIAPLKKCGSMNFCEKQPDNLVACITEEWGTSDAGIITSNDGGLNWTLLSGYDSNLYKKSIVAMSSDNPSNIIALNNSGMMYTLNGNDFFHSSGSTTLNSTCGDPFAFSCLAASDFSGININDNVFAGFKNVVADKNYDCVFYYYDWDGTFHATTDGGVNWCVINNTDLPSSGNPWDKARLISIPGIQNAGHLWINIDQKLWHSTDGGVNWTNYTAIGSVNKVLALSFGKSSTGNYENLYIFGSIDGVSGNHFYKSDDVGISWTKINDLSQNESWGDPKMIAGDRNVAERLYAAVSGQGVVFGDTNTPQTAICDNSEKTIKGEFNDINNPSIPDWTVSQISNASMTGTINNWTKAVLDITSPGVNNYDLQLWQDDLSMENGKTYLIRLDLRADDSRNVTIKLRNKSNGTTYLEREAQVLDTSQEYAYLIKPSVSDNDLRLTLMVGGDDTKLYIDHIRFKEFCDEDITGLDCIEVIQLNEHVIDPLDFKASSEISSNGSVLNNDVVSFSAGESIHLEAGFEVDLGATFVAEIVGCPE